MNESDHELLARYTRHSDELAFDELVRRHLDLVYSAAFRQVRSRELAQEVSQSVFSDLARSAGRLPSDVVLSAWLYKVTRRTAIDVVRREVRRQAREKIAAELNIMNAPDSEWRLIEPLLDQAMESLEEKDRTAVLLRFFENRSLREVGQTLGTSEDTAQKRVSRAVERLREYFSKCGATVGAGGLTALISARAVEAAPAGLASAICIGALPGGAASLSAAFAGTKGMMMTGLNKILIAAVLTGTVGSIIYGIRQAQLRQRDMQRMAQDRTAITEAIQRLQQERDQATNELAALREQGQAANRNKAELLRLRGMVTLLRNELGSLTNRAAAAESRADLSEHHLPWKLREARKFEEFQNVGNQTPEAAAETVLWAAYNQDTNVLSMVYLPEDAAAKADEMGRLDTLQTRLRAQILTTVLAVGSKSREVWLDGGQETVFRAVQGNTTNTYAGVIDFRLTARANPEDPATERHTDILFARVDGMWKMVIPGISPPIPEAVR